MIWGIVGATACVVFLRGIQQLNVIGGHYAMAAITSYAIAAAEVIFIVSVVDSGTGAILSVGTGGAIGVISAIYMHPKMKRMMRHV